MRRAGFLPRLTYGSATQMFLLAGIFALPFADLSISAVHPGAEFRRRLAGMLSPSVAAIE